MDVETVTSTVAKRWKVTSVIATSTDSKFAARITPNFYGKPDVGKHNYKNMLCICWLDPNT